MKVSIRRQGTIQTYEVPKLDDTMTVMDILDYIYTHLDHTLAYYRHSSCNQGICGRCALKLNGSAVLACAKEVPPETAEILLEPMDGQLVRDLVVQPR